MSGLQDYYNSVSAYSSNADSVNSFLSNYDDTFYSNFNDKVNEVKEQGKALVEAGGAVEGVYVGFKGVQKGVQAWRSKYGKKSGGDGDETGGGDDSNAGGGTEGETSGGLEDAGFTEEDAAGLFPDEAAPAGGGGGAPAGGGGDPDPIEGADPDAPFPDAPEVPEPFPDAPESRWTLVVKQAKSSRRVATLRPRPRQKHRLRNLPTLTQRTTLPKLPETSQPTFKVGENWAKWVRQVKVRVRVEVEVLREWWKALQK